MLTIKEQIFYYFKNNKTATLNAFKLKDELKVERYQEQVFRQSLKELFKSGVLRTNKEKKIYLNKNQEYHLGKVYTNFKGYGFLVIANHEMDDIFIPSSKLNNALHEDVVIVKLIEKPLLKQRGEGQVVDIVKRSLETLVGTFMHNEDNGFGFVIPDNKKITKDIFVPPNKIMNAKSYDKVVVQIEKYPERNRNPEGSIIEIIGVQWEKGVEALSILKDSGIRSEFPTKVLKQLDKITAEIPINEISRRLDLREDIIFTIDGSDSKDLDDAISIKRLNNGNYYLGVHIADVSHYVKRDSKLDKEALERATSVYLINKVVPMLPKKLSNGLCSLNPNEAKLTLTVFMEIDKNGSVKNHDIQESVISSKAKLNYTEVTAYLEGENNDFRAKNSDIADSLDIMSELMVILLKKRENRGSLEFDFPESKITLDENDVPIDIQAFPRGIANELIQEFMLVCNETVAKAFHDIELPFVYRVHEEPREERLNEFFKFAFKYGYSIPSKIDSEETRPLDLQRIMEEAKGKPEEAPIQLLMLQCMQQARYSPFSKGHFGLATEFYCHFTSPIRRYPDLEIHRIIKEYVNFKKKRIDVFQELEARVELVSRISSKKARVAERAENDYSNLKKVEYMKNHLGEAFEGRVIRINDKGMNIMLDNTVEGFLSVEKLDGIYSYIEEDYQLINTSGYTMSLGDKLIIQVDKVDIVHKKIDFKMMPHIIEN